MRLVSQNGNVDIPYDKATLLHAQDDVMARVGDKEYLMGKYSSMEKSYRVMEMVRNQYAKIEMIKVLSCGTCEYMDKSLNVEEEKNIFISYCKQNIFKFPKDEEVEVQDE